MRDISDTREYKSFIQSLKNSKDIVAPIVVEYAEDFKKNVPTITRAFSGYETEVRIRSYIGESEKIAVCFIVVKDKDDPLYFMDTGVLYAEGKDEVFIAIKGLTNDIQREAYGVVKVQKKGSVGETLANYLKQFGVSSKIQNRIKTKSNPLFLPANLGIIGSLLFTVGAGVIAYITSREVYDRLIKKKRIRSAENPRGIDIVALADNKKLAAEIALLLNENGIDAYMIEAKKETYAVMVDAKNKDTAENLLESRTIRQAANQPDINEIEEDVRKAYESGKSNLIGAYIDGDMGVPFIQFKEGKFNIEIGGIIGCKNDKSKQKSFSVKIPAIVDEWVTSDFYDDILSQMQSVPKWAEKWDSCMYIQITDVLYKPIGFKKEVYGKLALMNFRKSKIVKQNPKRMRKRLFKEEKLTCPNCGSPLKFYDLGNLDDGNVAPIFYCPKCKKYFADR